MPRAGTVIARVFLLAIGSYVLKMIFIFIDALPIAGINQTKSSTFSSELCPPGEPGLLLTTHVNPKGSPVKYGQGECNADRHI